MPSIAKLFRLFQGLIYPFCPPGGAPVWSLPPFHNIYRFARDLIASEFKDVACVIPGSTVITDGVLHDPKISRASNPSNLKIYGSGILLPPAEEVLLANKPFLGLWKLQNRVVMIDLMTDVVIFPLIFPLTP